MARPANPYSPILKRLALLQAMADKLNAEIASVTKLVADESAKISMPKDKPVANKGGKQEGVIRKDKEGCEGFREAKSLEGITT